MTTAWELTRDDIIKSALRKVGALSAGQTPSADDLTDCSMALNSLIQTLATEGMPLWKRTMSTVALVSGTKDYTVSNVWKIVQVYITTGNVPVELTNKSLYDLNKLPVMSGTPAHYSVISGLENATVRLWPTPNSATPTLTVVYQKEYNTFVDADDTPDFPTYWTDALIYGLAVRIAPEYGVPLQDRQELRNEYMTYKKAAESYMDEDGSLYFSPDRGW